MRNSTHGIIEVQPVSLLTRIKVHLRTSLLASRLVKCQRPPHHRFLINVTIFALKCLFKYFEEKAAFRREELHALVVFICCMNYKTASGG